MGHGMEKTTRSLIANQSGGYAADRAREWNYGPITHCDSSYRSIIGSAALSSPVALSSRWCHGTGDALASLAADRLFSCRRCCFSSSESFHIRLPRISPRRHSARHQVRSRSAAVPCRASPCTSLCHCLSLPLLTLGFGREAFDRHVQGLVRGGGCR